MSQFKGLRHPFVPVREMTPFAEGGIAAGAALCMPYRQAMDFPDYLPRSGAPMISVSDIASAAAIIFSGISLWHTSLRAAHMLAFVPPIIRYASPYQNSLFEAFEIPLTIINGGARTGTVLTIDLVVTDPKRKVSKRFYAAAIGPWNLDRAGFPPFTPIALAGRSSQSAILLFYPRTDETVMQIVQEPGLLEFALTLKVAGAGPPTRLMRITRLARLVGGGPPAPLEFKMDLPMLDHRSFTQGAGSVALNQPDWRAIGVA